MILPEHRRQFSIAAQKFLVFSFCFFIFYLLSFIFYLPASLAVPNDGTYFLQGSANLGGGGTSVTSADPNSLCEAGGAGSCKVTNFSIGEVAGQTPKNPDIASVCEAGGSGVCKINPGWLYTRTKYATSGNLTSTDFLLGEGIQTIDTFTYKMTALPEGTAATIQFSQNGTSWYSAAGASGGTTALSAGTNMINLSGLGWTAGTFYYKLAYTGPGTKTPSLDYVVLGYAGNAAKIRPVFTVSATDAQNDYLRYKIKLCTDVGMTTNCQEFDQTASQLGWSGQDAYGSSAYKSGSQAFYSMQADLAMGQTYYWQVWTVDPAGSNTWSAVSSTNTFNTNNSPAGPTITAPAHEAVGVSLTPVITLSSTDAAGDYIRYKLQLDTTTTFDSANLRTFDQTASQTGWSGQNAQASSAYNSGSTATLTVSTALTAGKRYFVRAYAKDPAGSNVWGNASTIVSFLTAGVSAGPCTSQPSGDYYIDENCSYTGSSEGVDLGNITVRAGSTFTLNANQSIVWNPGKSITIEPGAVIAINSSAKLTQSNMYVPSSGTTGYPDPIGFAGATAVYHFDDTSGSIGTSATGSNNVTATNTTVVSGKFGNARSFSGSGDYITATGTLTPVGAKTIVFWMYTTATTNQVIYDNSGNSSSGNGVTIDINSTPGKIRVSHAKGTAGTYNYIVTSTANINDGNWHHIVYTWDGTASAGGVKLYVDGVQNGTAAAASVTDNTPTNSLRLGAVSGGSPGSYYSGVMDELYIFGRAISISEIMGLYYPSSSGMQYTYQSTNPDTNYYRRRKDIVSAAMPIGEWKFDEQSGSGSYLLNTSSSQ